MKIYTLLLVVVVLAGLQMSCQYPVNSAILPENQKFLIIDAELTESYGMVHVAYTLVKNNANGTFYNPPTPPSTSAYVLDGHGNRTDFFPDGTVDSLFHGVVGETYKLYVQVEGVNYESAAETMLPCPEIDSIVPKYTRESFRGENDLKYDGFDVYVYLNDRQDEENYYQWDWRNYARAFACDRRFSESEGRDVLYPCSPYDCWTITYNPSVAVQSDKLVNGKQIAQKVARVPFIRPPYKYYLRIEQRAITPSVYAYLQSIETQTQLVGTLFDLPAQTKFSPNIYNVNDSKEQIIGAFSVFSSRHKIIYIDRQQKINGVEARDILDGTPFVSDPLAFAPCTENQYRTQKRPEQWED